jgi:hypothetical protein
MQLPTPGRRSLHRLLVILVLVVAPVAGCLSGCTGEDIRSNIHLLLEKQQVISKLQHNLLQASDAENNALLSPVDAEAKAYADTAREALNACGEQINTLEALIVKSHSPRETESFKTVSADFKELFAASAPLLELVGRNTNLRAAQLSRTEASLAVSRLQQTMTPILDSENCPAAKEGFRVIEAALSILALHSRHIDESTAAGMDSLEETMARQNERARTAFTTLASLSGTDASLQEAQTQAQDAYADFWNVTQSILVLSRENTNIEAAALTTGRKRLLQAKILVDLASLSAVVAEKEFSGTR